MPNRSALVKTLSTMPGTPAGVNFGFSPRWPSGTAWAFRQLIALVSTGHIAWFVSGMITARPSSYRPTRASTPPRWKTSGG